MKNKSSRHVFSDGFTKAGERKYRRNLKKQAPTFRKRIKAFAGRSAETLGEPPGGVLAAKPGSVEVRKPKRPYSLREFRKDDAALREKCAETQRRYGVDRVPWSVLLSHLSEYAELHEKLQKGDAERRKDRLNKHRPAEDHLKKQRARILKKKREGAWSRNSVVHSCMSD